MNEVGVADYRALHDFSLDDPAGFWRHVWDFCGVVGDPGDTVVVPGAHMRDTTYFPDARLNVAASLLRRNDDSLAMIFRGEDQVSATVTWSELHELVSKFQQALADAGVGVGDRVAAWLPNSPNIYALMLAATGLGAVFSSTSPDFGSAGVIDRFGQIEPKVLYASDGYWYGGKWFSCLDKLAEVQTALPDIGQVIVLPYDGDIQGALGESTIDGSALLAQHEPAPVHFELLPFDHPWYVLYSSGTTGKPKCIVHRAGGVLLKHMVEQQLHTDIRRDDRVFYFTTAGWMMWNWLASVLSAEATLVLYDGSPFHPDNTRLFDLVEELDLTLLGISAKFIDACSKGGLKPTETHDLSSLRTICSTGSTLVPEGFEYVYRDIHPDVHLQSMSGGTDLCGCLVAGDPTSPVFSGEIQRAGLAMAIEVVDDSGNRVVAGEQGELICSAPFPSMPLRFWDDPGDARYHAAYYERFPGRWHQGDFAEWTENGGMVIHGRSDATLNPGGVRIGTAEIYRQVEAMAEITESLVIGQSWDNDTRVVLFVTMAEGVELDDQLRDAIRRRVRSGASPRHVPAIIIAVADLPRTRSGKLTELAVRDIVHGRDVKNSEALANPEALDLFRDLRELQR